MEKERQNEIWRGLPNDFKESVMRVYNEAQEIFNKVRNDIDFYIFSAKISTLEDVFGRSNLTSPTKEKPNVANKQESELEKQANDMVEAELKAQLEQIDKEIEAL